MTTVGKGLRVATVTATGPAEMTYGSPEDVTITVAPSDATGQVRLLDGTHVVASGGLAPGSATLTIPGTDLKPGTHSLIVTYAGDDDTAAASTAISLTVLKATPELTVTKTPTKVIVKKTKAVITASLSAPSQTVEGTVVVTANGHTYVADLVDGTASVTLRPFTSTGKKAVVVKYLGSDLAKPVTTTITVNVVKR